MTIERLADYTFFGSVRNVTNEAIDFSTFDLHLVLRRTRLHDGNQEYVLRRKSSNVTIDPSFAALRRATHLAPGESQAFSYRVGRDVSWVFLHANGDLFEIPWDTLPAQVSYELAGDVGPPIDVRIGQASKMTYRAQGAGTLVVNK